MNNLNQLDKKILKEIQRDSRQSFRNLARKLHISIATASKRVKRLEKEKIIKSYATLVDQDKVDYTIKVLIDVSIAKGKLFEVEKKIASLPNVQAIYDITGQFDATIIANFKTRSEMDKFLKHIQTYNFIRRTETKLVLNTIKEDIFRLVD